MISINDYLYGGHTVLSILHSYTDDLRADAKKNNNPIDLAHSNFLLNLSQILEHHNFLTDQAKRITELYDYMSDNYPTLAFAFKGRMKSLLRTEGKFNGYITDFIDERYSQTGAVPTPAEIKKTLARFHDLIAYRVVVSVPTCHLKPDQSQEEEEIKYLYEIANMLPEFMEERGFSTILSGFAYRTGVTGLSPSVQPYFRDYIASPKTFGYRALHIAFYDNIARCYIEMQLRTKSMDDYAEIGPANHLGYEQRQETARARRDRIPLGECRFFDDAYERGRLLQQLELKELNVNMFSATSNALINDSCGLYRGRSILSLEHLSRFQNG